MLTIVYIYFLNSVTDREEEEQTISSFFTRIRRDERRTHEN
jgi:hypothetical protein